MLQRLIRNIIALFSVYGFSTNPIRYLLTLLGLTLFPYLLYLLFGSVAVIFLLAIAVLALWRALRSKSRYGTY